MSDMGHWTYSEEFDPEEFFGFIYIITNNTNKMKYVGRKQFGTWKKRKRVKESDWKKYKGSSKHLAAAIKEDGKENFTFDIFKLYKTRGALVYFENYYLYKFNVLTLKDDDGDFVYYNRHIGSIKFRPPFEISEETRYKMCKAQGGLNNPYADQKIYVFIHKDHGIEELTKCELRKKYNLYSSHLSKIVKGERKTHKGWSMFKEEPKDEG